MATLGIDFGTSNSAAATLVDGKIKRIQVEPDNDTLPTSVFFDFDDQRVQFGSTANQNLLNGVDGRYMRALKSVLGTSLMAEKRMIIGKHFDFYDIIAEFLSALKRSAEQSEGVSFDHALSGRPVYFHSADAVRNEKAEQDLRECYNRAGFKSVEFMFEPEAAALAAATDNQTDGLGLIVDIGGGTSDYCLFETGKEINILASHGVRLGGTNFDKILNLEYFMPLLGKGAQLKKIMSEGVVTAPNSIFHDLATWEKIPFCYTPELKNTVRDIQRQAFEPKLFARLTRLIADRAGHELAFLAETAKITANQTEQGAAKIALDLIDDGLYVGINQADLARIMSELCQIIDQSVHDTLHKASCKPEQVSEIIYVGGSSQMHMVQAVLRNIFPHAKFRLSSVFTAVVDGLALATG
ncbi:MAG: hsp70 family protein [Hyphomicrobiales bacterium]|nr:MAG: hsp70 family protein [Hyphomicrobiales bacterium]